MMKNHSIHTHSLLEGGFPMKRILKIIILLVLMVGLVGCNKIDEIFDIR